MIWPGQTPDLNLVGAPGTSFRLARDESTGSGVRFGVGIDLFHSDGVALRGRFDSEVQRRQQAGLGQALSSAVGDAAPGTLHALQQVVTHAMSHLLAEG